MNNRILNAKAGEKLLIVGNEAIVRGALEAGIKVATTYPGTPASEIGDTFNAIASSAGIHFEYSINEKVAFEVAYGACLGGVRSMTSMKHLGLNVAGDPFVTSAYVGAVGGFVIVSAGEPGCHTSPNEQDHRYFARMACIPVFDPSDPQEALEMTRAAYGLSEKWKLPVLMRPTTRVSHTQGIVTTGEIDRDRAAIEFVRDPSRFVPVPRSARVLRKWLIERIHDAACDAECRRFNRVEGSGKDLAIVTSGVSCCYVLDAVKSLNPGGKVRTLKLGIPYPLSGDFIFKALKGVSKVLVVEELEPFIEDFVKKTLFDRGISVPVIGKESGTIPLAGELTPGLVRDAVGCALSMKETGRESAKRDAQDAHRPVKDIPIRPPILCPGCPHRASFLALRLVAGRDDIFVNDIGCYTLGMDPPFNMGDILLSMGSGITQGGGFSFTTKKKILAFIGDSTFFHSGITGLANAVINRHNLLVVILDNRVTAMTGHQPSPSGLEEARGTDEVSNLDIEDMVRACGVENMVVVDPAEIHETNRDIRRLYGMDGVSVIISRHPCPLFLGKDGKAAPGEKKVYKVDTGLCRVCAQSCAEAACRLEPTKEHSFTRTVKRIGTGPDFQRRNEKPPCSEACPAGVCIQGFMAQAQSGDIAGAYKIIRRSLPLASILARVCPRPCEDACVRGEHDEPLAINDVKRYILDTVSEEEKARYIQSLLEDAGFHGRRVAVVGSGPAGISAAWELRLRGYDVTVFEKEKETGGLLKWGIPRFRLSGDILRRDVDEVLSTVTVKTGSALGRDFTIDDLGKQGFEAVFLGVGAAKGTIPELEGRDAEGVTQAIELMKAVESGEMKSISGKVVVVGGGDAAVDAARTALRLGAREAAVLYRRSREDMPACAAEVADAEKEGVRFLFRSMPVNILSNDGKAASIEFVRTEPGDIDASGRRKSVPVPGSEAALDTGMVIFATGQVTGDEVGGNLLKVDPVTMMTEKTNVFAGGDVVSGPATVVNALAAGRRAAWGIDAALRKDEAPPLDPGLEKTAVEDETWKMNFGGMEKMARLEPPALAVEERKNNFREIHGLIEPAGALMEASRCFACGICALCDACVSVLGCGAFYVGPDGKMQIDENLCNGCGLCTLVCPNHAIVESMVRPEEQADAAPPAGEERILQVIRSGARDAGEALSAKPLRVHFAGVGGQGTLSASGLVGEAAMRAGLNVIIGALHGMAQRGGMVANQLIIGDARSPIIDAGEADIIVGFEPLETLRSLHFGREGCIVFMNRGQVVPYSMTMQGRQYPDLEYFIDMMKKKAAVILSVDAALLAARAGNPKALSAVMLGFMAGAGVFPFSVETLRRILSDLSSPARVKVNLKAFDEGAALAPSLRRPL